MTWFSADYHFGHDREFIWKARGFNYVEEMNEVIVNKHNNLVNPNDVVYILGDIMLGDLSNIEYLNRMKGKKYIILGNHDSYNRRNKYLSLNDVLDVRYADMIELEGFHFYLSHYPTITNILHKTNIHQCLINLYGHTHQKNNFFYDIPFMYHVGVDSHGMFPVSINTIIRDIHEKAEECR